ncbi:MAG TPA: SDR family oxidoreductase [Candidatus Binatia bacterium]|nr:SDR family oxidoreductase [Candidatus Binatia bacterium]
MTTIAARHVVITGAASGIGRSVASRMADRAAAVSLVDIDEGRLARAVEGIRGAGGRACGYVCDVSDRQAVQGLARQITEEGGPVDILVNNAGVVSGGRLLDLTDQQIDRTFRVNVLALFWTTRAFLPTMIRRDTGHIVNIASAAGLIGTRRETDYAASKHAVVGFDEALRMELRRLASHVRTTVVCPYYIDTGMFAGVRTRVPWLLPILKEERVAAQIVRAVETNRGRLLIPWPVHLVPVLREVLPLRVFDMVADALGVNDAMNEYRGRATAGPEEQPAGTRVGAVPTS